MYDVLRVIFYAGAMLLFVYFLGMMRRKKWKNAVCAIAACIILGVLGYGSVILNNIRINGNREALKKSSIIQSAMKITESSMNRKHDIKSNPLNISAKEPWVIVPVVKENGHLVISNEDSRWSGGSFISAENTDKCKTILFYETSEYHQFYTSAKGASSTGVTKQRNCYLYDVETSQLFDYELLSKDLPNTAKGSPHLEVTMQEMIDWINVRIRN